MENTNKMTEKEVKHKKPMMFSKSFSFKGRISRMEFRLSFLVALAYYIIPLRLDQMKLLTQTTAFILIIPIVWFMIAQGTKRCHDSDKSGWSQLIPFIGISILFDKGQEEKNKYGESPKDYKLKDLIDYIKRFTKK